MALPPPSTNLSAPIDWNYVIYLFVIAVVLLIGVAIRERCRAMRCDRRLEHAFEVWNEGGINNPHFII
uniref:Uncharacterized protein n=1 Tax=Acrobeloides nanus TaxID=290746 RepID=A0A914DJD6_9BILA